MKNIIRKFISLALGLLAKKKIAKHKPLIIGITGSVGKTTTKEAINLVLKNRFKVLSPQRSYNTEIGLPLAVFNETVPSNLYSFTGWLKIFIHCIQSFGDKEYPQILILEYGLDQPGDIQYLTSLIKPDISVITFVSLAHSVNFGSLEEIAEEKRNLIKPLTNQNWAILNFDNTYIQKMASQTRARVLSFGIKNESTARGKDIQEGLKSLSFKLIYQKKSYPLKTKILGSHLVYNLLAGFCVGIALGLKPEDIIKYLSKFESPPGRMKLISGIKGSLIIDDSYNASPESMDAALEFFKKIHSRGRKIAVLGMMNELGKWGPVEHQKVGQKAAPIIDILITVGDLANKYLTKGALELGFKKKNIFSFSDSKKAGDFLKKIIVYDDLILVKGSQNNIRMEWLVEKIMSEPQKAQDLLVRQGSEWKLS